MEKALFSKRPLRLCVTCSKYRVEIVTAGVLRQRSLWLPQWRILVVER